MASIALFHSVLGLRPGLHDAASRLRADGHDVLLVDQYDGRTFDDYEAAGAFAEGVGYGGLMSRALDAVAELPDGFVALGFSNGGGMAEYVATRRAVAGVVLLSGTLPLEMLGAAAWPAGVPAQIHYAVDDPFRDQAWVESVASSVRSAGGSVEAFDYPGTGHLFTDPSLPAEYDAEAAELLWSRVLPFCAAAGDARRGA
jgi:dienelactone hydrolase